MSVQSWRFSGRTFTAFLASLGVVGALAAAGCGTVAGGGNNNDNNGNDNSDPPAGSSSKDSCASPEVMEDGTVGFSNVDATSDGPDEPIACTFFDYTNIESDIWFCYTATCTGRLVVSLCGSSYDTKMAVYGGCGCPSGVPVACNDDGCGFSTDSRVQFDVQAGEQYMIRIGGFEGDQGEGVLTVKCGDEFFCGDPRRGSCFEDTGTSYCDDQQCCETVCENDAYCCDLDWDEACAAQAEGFCHGQFGACTTSTAVCTSGHSGAGCSEAACCQVVCEQDPFCCLNEWDEGCAEIAKDRCDALPAPPGDGEENPGDGTDDPGPVGP